MGPAGSARCGWAVASTPGYLGAVTTAQLFFAIALGSITLLITLFAVYVVSTTMWGDRWFRRR